MTPQTHMPKELKNICQHWSSTLEKNSNYETRVAYIQKVLPDLLFNTPLFNRILENITDGRQYPDIREATLFSNEILLYTDPKRLFSMRMYLWGPKEYTGIHDHSAWGVMGPVSGKFEVLKFSRKDDGTKEGWADLVEKERVTISPGQTEMTQPLNNGIHKTGNPADTTTITIHIYGNPVRRSYINGFDLTTGKIYRMYAPRSRKRMLASEALRGLGLET